MEDTKAETNVVVGCLARNGEFVKGAMAARVDCRQVMGATELSQYSSSHPKGECKEDEETDGRKAAQYRCWC